MYHLICVPFSAAERHGFTVMKSTRILQWLLFFFFLLILIVPIVTLNTIQGKVSKSENRVLTSFPQLFDEDGRLKDNAQKEFTSFLEDNIGMRDQLIWLYSAIQYTIFHQSPSANVEVGKDGWLYYTAENNMNIADGNFPLTEEMLDSIKENLTQLSDYCKSIGTELILVLPPSKVGIYPEYVRGGDYSVRETPSQILAKYLEENTDLKVICLKEALLKHKDEGELLYFKQDTHWNFQGAYIGYKEIVCQLKDWGLLQDDPVNVSFYDSYYQGDLAAMMGNDVLFPGESILQSNINNPSAQRIMDENALSELHDLQLQYNAYATRYLYENKEKAAAPSMLVYGDSMFAHYEVTQLLAEHTSTLNFFWWVHMGEFVDGFTPAVLSKTVPDIFILEVGERDINLLAA